VTARYIWYARGGEAFTDPAQRARCLPVLAFLRGDRWFPRPDTDPHFAAEQTLPAGLVEVLHGGGGDGGLHCPPLVEATDYERHLVSLWKHPANLPNGDGLDIIINEQDIRPRLYAQYAELFDCDLSPICGFAYEMHGRWVGAPPAEHHSCTFGGCNPTACYFKDGRALEYPRSWATQAGMGLLRLKGALMARQREPGWPMNPGDDWRSLDSRFTPWLVNTFHQEIHVHWDEESPTKMVEHRHGLCVGDV